VAGLPRTRQRLVEEWEHFEEHRGLGRTDLKHGVRHEPNLNWFVPLSHTSVISHRWGYAITGLPEECRISAVHAMTGRSDKAGHTINRLAVAFELDGFWFAR
jgi:hypothetical protein